MARFQRNVIGKLIKIKSQYRKSICISKLDAVIFYILSSLSTADRAEVAHVEIDISILFIIREENM